MNEKTLGDDLTASTAKPAQESMNMNRPTNASKPDPLLLLAMAMGSGGASGMIEEMEAQGQRELVNSATLPVNIRDASFRAAFEAAGGRFLEPVLGDELFQRVQLPAGWSLKATDHSMWSRLVDDKGRERASIFYKAAFYDRDAFLNASYRYTVKRDYSDSISLEESVYRAMDGETVLRAFTGKRASGENGYRDSACEAAGAWMVENFPNWGDCGAYWD